MENNKSWLNIKLESRNDVVAFATDLCSIATFPTIRMQDVAKILRDYFFEYVSLDGRSEKARKLFLEFISAQALMKEMYFSLEKSHREMIDNPRRYCMCGCGYITRNNETFLPGHHTLMKNLLPEENRKSATVRRHVNSVHPLLSSTGSLYRAS